MNIKKTSEILFSKEPVRVEFTALDDLKKHQSVINTAASKAQGQLNSAIDALYAAHKSAVEGVSMARKASAMAKELGVDEGQFAGWEKQYVSNRDSLESAMTAISKLQNNLL